MARDCSCLSPSKRRHLRGLLNAAVRQRVLGATIRPCKGLSRTAQSGRRRRRPSRTIGAVGVGVAIAAAWLPDPNSSSWTPLLASLSFLCLGLTAWSLRSQGTGRAHDCLAGLHGSSVRSSVGRCTSIEAARARAVVVSEREARAVVEVGTGGCRRRVRLRRPVPGGEQRVRHDCIRRRPRRLDDTTVRRPAVRNEATGCARRCGAFGSVLVLGAATAWQA